MRRFGSSKRVARAEQPIELRLPSCLGYEKVAMDTVALIAERMGFRPEQIAGLRTAVAEAVTNAIEHGNSGVRNAEVQVMITAAAHGLIVCVRDQCYRRFNRSYGQEPPDLSRAFKGEDVGIGMWLIRQFVDEVEWTGSPRRGNEVRMVLRCR
jgi:serine/threonine-protein kinase RsbW